MEGGEDRGPENANSRNNTILGLFFSKLAGKIVFILVQNYVTSPTFYQYFVSCAMTIPDEGYVKPKY